MTEALATIIAQLNEKARRIRALEKEARLALEGRGDKEMYRRKLNEKTELLCNLPNVLGGTLAGLPADRREKIARQLHRFAGSAQQALELGSIFYMAALLYPADYRDGEPNDLERFLLALEEESGERERRIKS